MAGSLHVDLGRIATSKKRIFAKLYILVQKHDNIVVFEEIYCYFAESTAYQQSI
jgi:hypothetical protein